MTGAPAHETAAFLRRTLVVLAVVAVGYAIWLTFDILLLTFFGAFIAVLLRRCAMLVKDHTPLNARQGLAVVLVLLVVLSVGFAWLLGPQLVAQVGQLFQTLPEALRSLEEALRDSSVGRDILDALPSAQSAAPSLGNLVSSVTGVLTSVLGLLAGTVLVIAVAIYGALEPDVYRRGIVRLTPSPQRERVGEILDLLDYELWRWTCGQMIAMVVVGVLTFVGLWLLSVPSAFALGVIAALLDFIPLAGPIISTGIAMLVGFTVGVDTALYVLLVCTAIQQLEGNVLVPWVQKHSIWIPSIVSILAIAILGALFGPIGVILSGPLTTVTIVLVQAIYVEDVLGDRMRLPQP